MLHPSGGQTQSIRGSPSFSRVPAHRSMVSVDPPGRYGPLFVNRTPDDPASQRPPAITRSRASPAVSGIVPPADDQSCAAASFTGRFARIVETFRGLTQSVSDASGRSGCITQTFSEMPHPPAHLTQSSSDASGYSSCITQSSSDATQRSSDPCKSSGGRTPPSFRTIPGLPTSAKERPGPRMSSSPWRGRASSVGARAGWDKPRSGSASAPSTTRAAG